MAGFTFNVGAMISARDAVGKCLVELGEKYPTMLTVTADVDASSRVFEFQNAYPDRSINTGIAEQSLVSVCAGLAIEGYKPLAFAFGPFLSMRSCEQIRTDICYTKQPVVLIGSNAGYSAGTMGPTHCALEDSAIMCSIGNMTVLEPGDPFMVAKMLDAALALNAPVYIRLGREAAEALYPEDLKYEIGKAIITKDGDDGAFIVCGVEVRFALEAAKRIEEETGKKIRVVDMHTIKPIDREAVISAAKTGKLVCAQDHNLIGGLGDKVSDVIAEEGIACKLIKRGAPDEFVPIATPEFLWKKNGMDADGLYEAMMSIL